MGPESHPANDRGMGTVIVYLLRIGVLAAAAVVLVGGVLYLWRHGGGIPHYGTFRGEPPELRGLPGIIRDVAALRSLGIIQLGLLLLLITPIVRVIVALVAFARQRDRVYVLVTGIVLSVLLFSLTWGRI